MSKINVLDEHLTNMIAAGEVVERPMGVVKELVENSIDALSNKIVIRIGNGGLDYIEVIDNGIGMDQQDATKAFLRHATSKIKENSDLWNIKTMGFRGEALPSIASVSKVTMLTNDGNDSTKVTIEYGKIVEAKPYPFNQGTSVKVENLFYKTPARLKHMKSGNTEANMIIDIISKMALSHPEIAFELYCDDKLRIETNGSGSLQEVIMKIYGLEVAKKCYPVEFSNYDFKVSGLIVSPSITRSNKTNILCSINGRIIRSFLLQKAIIEGYSGFMMPERYPIVVLNIDVDYQLVDVNVHPSKWEIRLSKEKDLYALISNNIKEELRKNNKPSDMLIEHLNLQEKPTNENPMTQLLPESQQNENKIEDKPIYTNQNEVNSKHYIQDNIQNYMDEFQIDRFTFLAQYHGQYILASGDDTLYIIDQHAAMERCQYEEIQERIAKKAIECQPLLVPLIIELTPAMMNQLDYINEMLECISLKLEQFSFNSVSIREMPLFIQETDEEKFIRTLIEEIVNDKKMSVLDVRKEKIASLACHSSIKFNAYLSIEECKKLLSRLSKCKQPFNCPHGRPTMISITDYQLQKEFKRV